MAILCNLSVDYSNDSSMIEYFRLNLLLQTIQFYRLKKVNFRSFAMT